LIEWLLRQNHVVSALLRAILCNPQATDAVELIVVFSQATNGGRRWMLVRILCHSGVN